MTYFTGALPRPSRDSLSLGQAGATKVSTTNLPSGPLSTVTAPPGPSNIVTLSASFCVSMGTALNLARMLASRSAGEGDCCAKPAVEARSNLAGKRCARTALPARVAEPRNISRRDVCFCKKLNFMFFSPFVRSGSDHLHARRFSSRRVVHERDTSSKLFCRFSLIERNAIPRDLDFQHQAALLLASPTSASGMMRVQPYCHEENRFATRRFRIASN